jgi:tetratricopeptide (TPR) repeat protein
MLLKLGRLEEAERLLRRRLTIASDNKRTALSYTTLGHVLLEQRRYDEALSCFETSLQHWPGRGSPHRFMAETYLRIGGRAAEAVQQARLAVQEDRTRRDQGGTPEQQAMYDMNLGEDLASLAWAVATDSHDPAEVDRLVEEAVSLVGTAASPAGLVHYQAGQAYLTLGNPGKSAHHLSEAARIDPHGTWGRAAKAMSAEINQ